MVKHIAFTLAACLSVCALVLIVTDHRAFPHQLSETNERHFIVANARGNEIFLDVPAPRIDHIELEWIHSVEKEPWRELYTIQDQHLILTDVFLEGYGAGVPSDLEGTTVNENGTVHTFGIDRDIERLNWVHSHATHHTLRVFLSGSSEPRTISQEIPHHTFATAFIGTAEGLDK